MKNYSIIILRIAIFVGMLSAIPAWAQKPAVVPDYQALVDDYTAAWREPDDAKREALLAKVWASDGTYTDPGSQVRGRKKLAEHIALMRQMMPSQRVVELSHADAHHGVFRFAWRSVMPDGTVLMQGVDFGEVDRHGRIRRIVGFFGPLSLKPVMQ